MQSKTYFIQLNVGWFISATPPQNRKLSNTQQLVVMMAIAEIFRCECRGNGVTLISLSLSLSCHKSYDISESPPPFFFCLTVMELATVYMAIHVHPCIIRNFYCILICFFLSCFTLSCCNSN